MCILYGFAVGICSTYCVDILFQFVVVLLLFLLLPNECSRLTYTYNSIHSILFEQMCGKKKQVTQYWFFCNFNFKCNKIEFNFMFYHLFLSYFKIKNVKRYKIICYSRHSHNCLFLLQILQTIKQIKSNKKKRVE